MIDFDYLRYCLKERGHEIHTTWAKGRRTAYWVRGTGDRAHIALTWAIPDQPGTPLILWNYDAMQQVGSVKEAIAALEGREP